MELVHGIRCPVTPAGLKHYVFVLLIFNPFFSIPIQLLFYLLSELLPSILHIIVIIIPFICIQIIERSDITYIIHNDIRYLYVVLLQVCSTFAICRLLSLFTVRLSCSQLPHSHLNKWCLSTGQRNHRICMHTPHSHSRTAPLHTTAGATRCSATCAYNQRIMNHIFKIPMNHLWRKNKAQLWSLWYVHAFLATSKYNGDKPTLNNYMETV